MIPPKVLERMAHLRRLAERPGTVSEGKAARRALRRLERKWQTEVELREAVPLRPHVCAVACWVEACGRAVLRSTPMTDRGRLASVSVVPGTGYAREAASLIVVEVRRGSEWIELGQLLEVGDVIEVVLRSRWPLASRVSVHLVFETEGDQPVAMLAG